MRNVFTNQVADGDSAELRWSGGYGTVFAEGDFGGATLLLKVRGDQASNFVSSDVELSSPGVTSFLIGASILRFTLTGSTALTDVTVDLSEPF